MEDVLINKRSYFEEKTIEKIKTEFKFSQSRHIEMLLWDFEIFAQMVSMNKDFVLKGGAATQIYLPVDKQRASRDIDFATTLAREQIEATLDKIKKKFRVVLDTPILLVIHVQGIELIVHGYGELMFKKGEDMEWMEKVAKEIYEIGML